MANSFGSLVFTSSLEELQRRHGSRRQYERLAAQGVLRQGLGPDEREFIRERNSFYMSSVESSGWPYVQHRGGPKGCLKVLDNQTVAQVRLGENPLPIRRSKISRRFCPTRALCFSSFALCRVLASLPWATWAIKCR